jgi:hypothetical protein
MHQNIDEASPLRMPVTNKICITNWAVTDIPPLELVRLLPARTCSLARARTGRKNSLTFGSHDGAEVSVIYHTFIETCKMCGVSTLEYFKEFFKAAIKREQFRMYSRNVERELAQVNLKAIMLGRTDYERSAMPLCLQRICYR